MPRVITRTVYTFQELLDLHKAGKVKEKAIDKARQWLRDANTDGEWYEWLFETWTDALAQIGFADAKIAFSGFWCQGDGASFTATIDIAKLADFLATEIEPRDCIDGQPEDFRPWIVHKCDGKPTNAKYRRLAGLGDYLDEHAVERTSHHYSHKYTCATRLSVCDYDRAGKIDGLLRQCREDAEKLRLDLCEAIYSDLDKEYEDQTGDEAIAEFAAGNDYTFTISGEREG